MKQFSLWPTRGMATAIALCLFFIAAPAAHAQTSLSPSLVSFPTTAVTNNSAAKTLTLSNGGNSALNISGIGITGGDFDQTNNCGKSLAAKKTCAINVVFNPASTGTRAGIVTVSYSGGLQLALVSGSAISQTTISPASIMFAAQPVNSSSAVSAISLKNNQNIALAISKISTTGDFAQTNTCGTSLAAGAACAINTTFKPTATGSHTGSVVIADNATPTTQTLALSGTGSAPVTVSPASLAFSTTQTVGIATAAQVVTVKNLQGIALPISSVAVTGDYAQTNTCGSSLAAGASCSVNVTFKPTTTGSRTGTLSITDGAIGSPQKVSMTGSAVAATVKSIAVTPATASIAKGKTQQFTAVVTYTSGATADVTATATWTSSAATVASVSKGMAAAVAAGSAKMTASVTGSTITGSAALTVTTPTLVSVAVTPNPVSVVKGKTQQFTANGTYSDGSIQNLTVSATWTSGAGATITTSGMATATAVGSPVITAKSGTIAGSAAMTVQPATLVSIAVTPATASIAKGKTQQFAATGTYSDGTTQVLTSSVSWTASTGATISTAGLATGNAVAASTITATSGAVTGNAALNVQAATLVSIAVTPATAAVPKGKTQQYTATGTYTDGTAQVLTTSATWTSAAGASISGGLATATAVGSPVITATSGSISGTAVLTVQPAALVSISVSPATASIAKGLTQQYSATGTYTDGTTASVSATWSSSTGASIAATGLATGTGVGAPVITATSGSISGTAVLTVQPAALVSIAVTPSTASIAKGLTQQFSATGTYTDATTQNLTGSVIWSSSAEASIIPGGLATAMQVGTPAISATSGSITGSVILTVQPATLVSIAVSPSSATIVKGASQQFIAQGTYSDASVQDISGSVIWSSSTGASMVGGVATGTAAGTPTITAVSGSVSGSALLTVQTPALVSITVSPASVSLGLHSMQQFTAMGTYADNSTADITHSVVWNTGNSSVVTISGTGVANVIASSSNAIPITAVSNGITSNWVWLSALADLQPVCSAPTIDMKLLIVTNGQSEADFPAIKQGLDYLGTPYTVFDMSTQAGGLTPDMLSDGNCHGYYQGVIFAFGNYIYSLPGMPALTSYEQIYHVRQVNWFVYPDTNFGLNTYNNYVDAYHTYNANFTPEAGPVFSYVNTATPVDFSGALVYLATANDGSVTPLPSGASVTPLLTDASGNALSVVYNLGDGREYLSQTFDSNQYLKHNLLLSYGLINWVTKGIFLGEYHVYAAAQVDDFFINDAEWVPGTSCIDPITHDRIASDDPSLPTFRLKLADMTALSAWQNSLQNDPLLKGFQLTLGFNGIGTVGNKDWTGLPANGVANDDLVTGLSTYEQYYHWVTHTYDHPETLNGLNKSDGGGDPEGVDSIDLEILTNLWVASGTTQGGVNLDVDPADSGIQTLHFTDFNPASLISPAVTGLNDQHVPAYLYADGIRYAVSDTSVKGQTNNGTNPSPNVGIVNSFAPGIYEVPRYPNSIYYNAANWQDDEAEFHCIYGPDPGPATPIYDTYVAADILNYTSDTFVNNMLKGDMDPQMFHQPNLHAYDGTNSLISDVYNQTFAKYEALFKLPVLSLTIDQLGESMKARNNYNLSGATASLVNAGSSDASVSITVPNGTTVPSAVVPVTGLNSNGAESYGGQNISHVAVSAGQTVSVPMQ